MRIHIRTVLILFLLAPCARVLAAPHPGDDAILTSKGLVRVGVTYLLPADVHLREKFKATRQGKMEVTLVLAKRSDLEAKIRNAQDAYLAASAQDHDILVRMKRVHDLGQMVRYNALVDESHVYEAQMVQAQRYEDDLRAQLSRVAIPTDKYINALTDLSDTMEATYAAYQNLADDPQVKDALARINAEATLKYRLGPSSDFMTNLPLVRAERETVRSGAVKFNSSNGGLAVVDVVLNAQKRVPMLLDSGASFVAIPFALADEIGATPGPDDHVVQLGIANGKSVSATIKLLKSVQLGQFIVHDVECVVMPPSAKDTPLLLGGSFLKNFVYKMDLSGGQVLLTQINGRSTPTDTQSGGTTPPGPAAAPPPDPDAVAKAIGELQTKPYDVAANFTVGRYCCFTKGDWAEGLPMLAKGSDARAKTLAAQELKNPSDPDVLTSLADGWWDYADKAQGAEKSVIQAHAQDFYRKALPGLKDLAKLKAEMRLASAKPLQPATPQNGGPTSGEPPQATSPTPALPQGEDFRELLPSKAWKHPGQQRDDGLVAFGGAYNLETPESFKPPVIFRFVVQPTVKNSVRPQYDTTNMELESGDKTNRILITHGPANGAMKKGVGEIPSSVWTTIDMIVEPNVLILAVDGKERFRTEADFSQSNGPFRLHSIKEGVVLVKSIQVGKLRDRAATSSKRNELPTPDGQAFTNSIGMNFIRIEPGTFMMGSPESELGRTSGESPQHQVTLTHGFHLAQTLTTQEEYRRVMGENPSVRVGPKNTDVDLSDFPVENVSWEEANEFCRKLSEMPDEKRLGHVYRLPTEAEWEYACRAGTKTAYYFGDEPGPNDANIGGVMPGPTRVGSYPPNPWGLYDMCGNVWEWCLDDNRHYDAKVAVDPRGMGSSHVRRGGQYNSPAIKGRSAGYREGSKPDARNPNWGFRIVMESGPLTSTQPSQSTSPQGEKAGPVAPKNPDGKGLFGTP